MYQGKRFAPKGGKRTSAVIIAVLLVLALAVGGTVAYIIARSDEITNVFSPSQVLCEVTANADDTFTVKNAGDVEAYLRAAVVVNWENASGEIYWQNPAFTVSGTNWKLGSDGYYYYDSPVAAETAAPDLLTVTVTETGTVDGFTVSVKVLGEAIQSVPAEAVAQAWPGRPQ